MQLILKFLHKLWWGTPIEDPPPLYPPADGVVEWMEAKAKWFEKHMPDKLYTLFDPSCGDYIPKYVHVATSQDTFHTKYLEAYREIKKRYPDHLCKRDPTTFWIYYPGGDPQDYQQD